MSSPPEQPIAPEIVFLVKAQAKAMAQINALQKRVEELEKQISHSKSSQTDQMSTTLVNTSNPTNNKERIAISDDSGGEYSRVTTTSDDDELSLLLDQISKRCQQIQISPQPNSRFKSSDRFTDSSQTPHHSSKFCDNCGLSSVPQAVCSPQTRSQFSTASSSNWQLAKAKGLVKDREKRELSKEMKLNEEWLQNQLKEDPKQHFRTNFLDSLEPPLDDRGLGFINFSDIFRKKMPKFS